MASKRRIRRKACGSKAKYETQEKALSAAFGIRRKTGDSGRVNAYRCKHCNQFHWGHWSGKT